MKSATLTLLLAALAVASPVDWPWDDIVLPPFLRPTVDPQKLGKTISKEKLMKHATTWQGFSDASPDKNRAFGSVGHQNTVDYIYNKLKDHYKVTKQEFTETYSTGSASFSAKGIEQGNGTFTYAPAGKVSADVVVVSNLGCNATDYPDTLKDKIALISRGSCEFGLKSALAGSKGAKGAVIYNNVPGPLDGTLGAAPKPEGPFIPTAGISQENGKALANAIANGETVQGILDVKALVEKRKTHNVIAETKEGDHENVLVLGGHTDSVAAGPGINDNGSGSMGILEIALQLRKFKVKNAVRFAFFSAEEFGLLGSKFYVASLSLEERKKVRAYLNFDMIASPNAIKGIYDGDGSAFNKTGPAGSDAIEKLFEAYFDSRKQPHVPTDFSGRSDYGPFLEANIAAGGLFTGAEGIKTEKEARLFGGTAGKPYDPNYHKIGDTVANLDIKMWVENTQAIAHAVGVFGVDWTGIPKSEPKPPVTGASIASDSGATSDIVPAHSHCGHKIDEL